MVLSVTEGTDIESVRRLLYNRCGIIKERFVLVEFATVLYAGFCHTLRRMQDQVGSEDEIAFSSSIIPMSPGASPTISPPAYAEDVGFAFQLDCLQTQPQSPNRSPLTLRLHDALYSEQNMKGSIDRLCDITSLDRGQATALCENLCRGLALTQGPPGTGKT